MLATVVIPALDEAGHVGKAVKSLVGQTLPRDGFEIVVIDNGSTDGTGEEAMRAGADLVVVEEKRGLGAARSRGLAVASGDIVAFLDADCQAPPDWLEGILREFESHPGLVALGGSYDLASSPRFQRLFSIAWQHVVIPAFIAAVAPWKPAAVLFGGNWAARREALQRIGFNPDHVFHGEDTLTAFALARHGRVAWIPGLSVKSSDRRYREEGALRLFAKYLSTWLSVYIRGKPINMFNR